MSATFGQLNLSKIVKIDATRCQISRQKIQQILFRLRLCRRPRYLTALPRPSSWI